MNLHITKAALTLAMAAVISVPSWCTDGYFTNGFGVKSKAMAGATSALSQDTQAAATNPAGMVAVGTRFDIGLNLFSPIRDYSVAGNPSGAPRTFPLVPSSVGSGKKLFYMPDMGYNKMLDENSSLGITMYGNGGMNTTWPATAGGDGAFHAGAAGVNMEQLFIAGTYARKVTPKLALGISLIYVMQNFEVDGVSSFGSMVSDGNPDNLSNNGRDTSDGVGVRVGMQADVSEKLTLSAVYEPKIKMGKFTRYSDLFAQQGGFDIPANGTIGLAYRTNEASVVTFDIKKIWYSDVASVGNPFANIMTGMGGDPSYLLGGDNGPGFGWRDVTVYKLGYQTQGAADWVWRAGISYGRQPIPSSEVLFNILAPGVQEWHYTLGGTKELPNDREFSFALAYSPANTVSGTNPMEAPGQQQIDFKMHQLEFMLGYAIKF